MLLKIAKAFMLIGIFWVSVGVSAGEAHMPFSKRGDIPDFAPGQVIVKLKPGYTESDLNSIKEEYHISRYKKDRIDESLYLVYIPTDTDIPNFIEEFRGLPMVEYVTPNHFYYTTFIPNDTYFNHPTFYQWALMQPDDKDIDADSAWDISQGSPTIKIGVIDSGVDRDHPDLVDNLLDGYDFVDYEQYPPGMWEFVGDYQTEDDDPTDDYGHGTHVSGIASAKGNNGRGIAGVNWNSKIVPLRAGVTRKNNWFYYYDCVFSVFDIRDAINYAVGEGCKVINMSLGGRSPDTLIHNAIINAYNAGCVLVASSGNNSSDQVSFPAAWPEVIAVGATERTDLKANYSNYGDSLDVAAPGGKYDPYSVDADYVISTAPCYWVYLCAEVLGFCYDPQDPENYSLLSGTSMAAPHVSGLAALILTVNSTLLPSEVREIIEETAEQVGDYYYDPVTGKSQELGHGRINAYYALCATLDTSPFTEYNEFGTGVTWKLAWGDYDNDGDLDLATAEWIQKLYINNFPDSGFMENTPFSAGVGADDLCWGDYDNDGDLDVAFANQAESDRLCRNNGDGSFTCFESFSLSYSFGITWGDYDNDGDIDLAVANGTGHDRLYRNELYSSGGESYPDSFTQLTEFGAFSRAIAWADFDNDGDLDLAANGQILRIYGNDGDGTFTQLDLFPSLVSNTLTWGDYDNDGDLDLAVGTSAQDKLFVNNYPNISFSEFDEFSSDVTDGVQWGDADNDGDLDLAVGLFYNLNRLYINKFPSSFDEMTAFGFASDSTTAVSWGDFDCDGDLDLAVANFYSIQNKLYVNKGTNNDYVKVKLVGRRRELNNRGYSNRDGIGAKVRVFDQSGVTLFGFREISSHGGAPLEAHFGVPEGNTYKLEVYWPTSGITIDTLVIAPAVITVWEYCRGDANGDKTIDLGDVVRLINYLYKGGAAPDPLSSGDANGDGIVELGDITYLLNYLHRGGPAPPPPNCP